MHEALVSLGVVTVAEALANPQWKGMLEALAKDRRATCLAVDGTPWAWCAAERLPQAQAIYPHATARPGIAAPVEFSRVAWSREEALVEILRGRLGGLGPVPVAELVATLRLETSQVEAALLALEAEGFVMRGRFTPVADAGGAEEWCERHLLARIHRYTLGRLRREIEPVPPRVFMRFLCDWQRASPDSRASGPEALAGVLAQLEGFEAPAAAWESELLPARVGDYSIAWLDELCGTGRIAWARLREAPAEGQGRAAAVRATPVVVLPRRQLAPWNRLAAAAAGEAPALSSRAHMVLSVLREQGASFFDELMGETRLLRTELEDALAELVARGQASCDSFAGLRALLVPQGKRSSACARRGRRGGRLGIGDAGRWAATRRGGAATAPTPEDIEHVARVLLRRYGVVCWRLLAREAPWLPPWRELLRVYQRLEARGEIRGGRFVDGLSGEQFALPEAIASLRQLRRRGPDGRLLAVSALDPLNLAGTVLAGDKVPRQSGARVLYRDGVPVGSLVAGTIALAADLPPELHADARRLLLRERRSGGREPAAQPSA
jgi:ATP-dependent helicase Lhr and Lhr-like helicase